MLLLSLLFKLAGSRRNHFSILGSCIQPFCTQGILSIQYIIFIQWINKVSERLTGVVDHYIGGGERRL